MGVWQQGRRRGRKVLNGRKKDRERVNKDREGEDSPGAPYVPVPSSVFDPGLGFTTQSSLP